MPGQHARAPVPYRPPADLRDWLPEEAERHGIAVNLVITESLSARRDSNTASGGTTARKPARAPRRAAPVAPELARERARDQRDDDAPVCLPGMVTVRCVNCGEPIRRTEPRDGIDPRDYQWVHEDGNPVCDFTPVASPGGDGNG